MAKLKVSLGIGLGARQEDVIDICDDEIEACTDGDELDELLHQYWSDWSNNYIDGGFELL